ncbi:MAG: 30S ribosomal protein S4 [Clostridiales bacterium]|nr:30S ribosomal protein S4 [Clostridiales bacterium]
MARNICAACRQCRREGQKLMLKGERCISKKCAMERRPVPPGPHANMRRKNSEYNTQLREKQKVKRIYGVLEKQFHMYYERAEAQKGVTGENMLAMLEKRLDNVVYRMGIGASRKMSRQVVNHGHILVNGKRVDIPSYQVKLGDEISVRETSRDNELFKELRGAKVTMPKWLTFDTENFVGKIVDNPKRDDIDLNINEQLIVELYSK